MQQRIVANMSSIEERKIAGIEFSWPIEPQYQPLIHDFYYCDIGEPTILGFTHNNGKLQKKLYTTLAENVRHRAFDITVAPYTPILPAASGCVQAVWNRVGKDQRITIVHEGENGIKIFTEYWHLGEIFVKKGDVVNLTTVIAHSGCSGGIRIPHLHFSIRVGKNDFENTVNPLEVLPQRDFTSLPGELSPSDGFAESSIALYDEIMKKGWDFKVYVKTKNAIESFPFPVGTVLELLSKRGEMAEIEIDGKVITCNADDLAYIIQESSNKEEKRKIAGIEFSWPTEPQYQPLVHDFYYCDLGQPTISGFTHNNVKLRKKLYTTLATDIRHRAFDINLAPGTPIFPAASGYVQAVWNRPGKDQRITVIHEGQDGVEVFTEYWHLGEIFVKKGDKVNLTTVIANSGFSGGAIIPHLHFSIRVGVNSFENTIDPLEILPQRDFASLPNRLSSSAGFADSSIFLYDDIMKKGWDFKVYVKTRSVINSIPIGTILELIRKKGELAEVKINDKKVTCNANDLDYIFQKNLKLETVIHETLIPIGIARGHKSDHILGKFGRNYRETLFYVGQNFGLNFILFCEKDIDLLNKKVKGVVLKNGIPMEGFFNIPRIIENSYYLPMDIQDELRKISHLVRPKIFASKEVVNKQLSEEGSYKDILIPTVLVRSFEDILNEVKKARIVIKHVMGMEGKSVIAIEKINDIYILVQMQEHLELTLEELHNFYNEFICGKKYILQPFINSVTKHGEPFDIRISVRRGENGEFMYKHLARIGNSNGIVSNLASGGYIQQIDTFLFRNYGEKGHKTIVEELDVLGEEFPNYFNKTFYRGVELYNMGLDIGIVENEGNFNLHLFELNLRDPGGSHYDGYEEQIAQCQYFKYLHNQLLESPSIQFTWPIEPKYKPTLHDHYWNDFGIKLIGSLIHNNGKKRLKSASALSPEINSGFDIIAKPKSPVYAASTGTVIDVSAKDIYKYIVIFHDLTFERRKVYTKYMNLSKISVNIGDVVSPDHIIGESGGNIGRTRIPNLHFKVMVGANAPSFTVDPLKVLPMRDFSKLRKTLLTKEGFSTSSIHLYESMLDKGWEFSVLSKMKIKIGDIPEGAVVELISMSNGESMIRYNDHELICKTGDLRYNF